MSATIIPLHRSERDAGTAGDLSEIEALLRDAASAGSPPAAQLAQIRADLRAYRAQLLEILTDMRSTAVRGHPESERIAADVETVAARTLDQVDLAIRQVEALAVWPPRER